MKPILFLAVLALSFTACSKSTGGSETAQYYVTEHCHAKTTNVYCSPDTDPRLETLSGDRLKAAEAGRAYVRKDDASVRLTETYTKP